MGDFLFKKPDTVKEFYSIRAFIPDFDFMFCSEVEFIDIEKTGAI